MTLRILSTHTSTLVRRADATDFAYIDALRKKEAAALGFIPKQAYLSVLAQRGAPVDRTWRSGYSSVYLTVDNAEPTGFVYASFSGRFAHVFQIVIQQDARRWERATLLIDTVEREARERGNQGILARVAYDLEANFFWRAIGYQPLRLVTATWLNQREAKSKRPLWLYMKRWYALFPEMESLSGDDRGSLLDAQIMPPPAAVTDDAEAGARVHMNLEPLVRDDKLLFQPNSQDLRAGRVADKLLGVPRER